MRPRELRSELSSRLNDPTCGEQLLIKREAAEVILDLCAVYDHALEVRENPGSPLAAFELGMLIGRIESIGT